ncbi:hypothetical protein [Shewanella zhangzhouensis]|uniref:hypothetical protein n=1 Tax=Shewanella zhangzhouensis TaxID=2864213 RepID=UPI001C65E955|nr:hypothetical protein [Shewanella zhangzhouensis]QYK06047.1 hypothetical protein K0H63_04170 [Shewanella zhangzhouensis]
MDQLALTWELEETKHRQKSKLRLGVNINGVRLTEIISQFEQQQGIAEFNDVFLHESDVQEYSLFNWLKSLEEGDVRIILLGCSCGQVECSFFYANVCNRDGWVYWQFDGWPKRDYSEFPSFWFNASEYQQVIEDALLHYQ